MKNENLPTTARSNELLAEGLLRAGHYEEACKAYACLPEYLKKMPADSLITCGDKLLVQRKVADALSCYSEAGAIGKLIELGKTCRNEDDDVALQAFIEAKDLENIIALGEKHFALDDSEKMVAGIKVHRDFAMHAFVAAGIRDKLIILGERYIKSSSFDNAIKCYKAAGAIERLVALGDEYFQLAKEDIAQSASGISRYRLPIIARDAYFAAGARDKLITLAEAILTQETSSYEAALEKYLNAYNDLHMEPPVESLMRKAEAFLSSSDPNTEAAQHCYKLVAEIESRRK
jgi:hypothetical protein